MSPKKRTQAKEYAKRLHVGVKALAKIMIVTNAIIEVERRLLVA